MDNLFLLLVFLAGFLSVLCVAGFIADYLFKETYPDEN